MIGGNILANFQIKTAVKNEIGESVNHWNTVYNQKGWLDFTGGESKYSSYKTKLEESSHLFLCDYFEKSSDLTSENSRLVIDGQVYDVLLIDDPMNLHQHFEIYLKLVGLDG